MTTVVVSGALANKPRNGGEAWVRLSWIEGFRRLGLLVHFVEQIAKTACVDHSGVPAAFEDSLNLAYFQQVTETFGLAGCAALICDEGNTIYGSTRDELLDLAEEADLLVNISGNLAWEPMLRRLRRKAYIDIDPGFTQLWHAAGTAPLPEHDDYFTIGENIGHPDCSIPTGGIRWRPIRQPVVLEHWPVSSPAETSDRLTTIASWRGAFGPVEHAGKRYGLKAHEFRKFASLPSKVRQKLEIALSIHPADQRDLDLMRNNGWHIIDPSDVAATPQAFRHYVQGSGGEFSVAQGIYVETNSGWFSDRTIRYLASGKPVLVQEAGFSRSLPAGEGLIPFHTFDEAVAGAERIRRNYDHHCRSARRLAEEFFDSDKVLSQFLEEVGISP